MYNVYDVLVIIPKNNVNTFLDYTNSLNINIRFTSEIEENNCIPFFDVQISKDSSGSLSFSIYKNPSHTDKCFDFKSNHPLQQKLSVMQTLLHRADRLCSNEKKSIMLKLLSKIMLIQSQLSTKDSPTQIEFIHRKIISNTFPLHILRARRSVSIEF